MYPLLGWLQLFLIFDVLELHGIWGSVAKNSESILKVFPQTQIPGEMY